MRKKGRKMNLNEKRLAVLCDRINERTGKKNTKTLDDIINNIEVLSESKEVGGEIEKYLPLQVKEELFHLLYPQGYIDADVNLNMNLGMAMAKATVHDDEGKIIGVGFADQKVDLMPVFDGDSVRWQGVRRLAKGRATSDALRAAGIASWFKDDPLLEKAIDEYDADKNTEKPEDMSSEIAAKLEAVTKTQVEAKKAETISEIAKDIPDGDGDEIPFDPQEPSKNPPRDIQRAYILKGGSYDGKTIGEVEKEKPSYLISILRAYETGKMPKADPALIDNIKMVVSENRDGVFGKIKLN